MKVSGALRFPGDKSLSHRAAIFSAIAEGRAVITNFLEAEDTLNTLNSLKSFGVSVEKKAEGIYEIDSPGLAALRSESKVSIDMGNSGTGSRLMLGLLSGIEGLQAVITGDKSLQKRPMKRVTGPLTEIGASFEPDDHLPIQVNGRKLNDIKFTETLGSAQVKSAMLLAGLASGRRVEIEESKLSRDHTENLLLHYGADLKFTEMQQGRLMKLAPPYRFKARDLKVRGDISSAAFFAVLAVLADEGSLLIKDVLLNPHRDRFIRVLQEMGAKIEILPQKMQMGESGGDLYIEASALKGFEIPEDWVPGLIDELPVLTIAGIFCEGTFSFRGARELRVKESDRIAAMTGNLRNLGVEVEEYADGLSVKGDPARSLSGTVDAHMDHRIIMSFEIAALKAEANSAQSTITINDRKWVNTSFPAFYEKLKYITDEQGDTDSDVPPVVTLDGPAGSGKSTLAARLAAEYHYYQIDSGALYRTFTLMALTQAAEQNVSVAEVVDTAAYKQAVSEVDLRVEFTDERRQLIFLNNEELTDQIRTPEVTAAIKAVADAGHIREQVNQQIRQVAEKYPVVADGRDMGTVVFTDAHLKFFVTASLRERARRRFAEFAARHPGISLSDVEAQIAERDKNDREREFGGLAQAEDAIFIDTTNRNFDSTYYIIDKYMKTFRV